MDLAGTRSLLYCLLFPHEKVKKREEKSQEGKTISSDVAEHIQAHPIGIVCARLKKQRQTSNQGNPAEPERQRKKHNFKQLQSSSIHHTHPHAPLYDIVSCGFCDRQEAAQHITKLLQGVHLSSAELRTAVQFGRAIG